MSIGYDKLVLDVSWDGSRDAAAKTVTIRDFTLSIENGGDLSFEGLIGEVPDAHTLNDPTAAQNVTKTQLHNLTIRYDDNSLAGRIMDYLAKQQNLSREDYANQISAALPFLLAALNNQPFQEKVATALGGFLQDPKSLTIELSRRSPGLRGRSHRARQDRARRDPRQAERFGHGQHTRLGDTTMIGRIAAAGFLLLAAAVPAAADPTGEGLLRDFVGVGRLVGASGRHR